MNVELKKLSDEEIASALADEFREEYFNELFKRYKKRIYLWCYRYTHDVDEAIDLSQEVFIKLYRGIRGFYGQSHFSTWLYIVTRNCCLDELSRRRVVWSKRTKPLNELDGAQQEEWCSFFDRRRKVDGILEIAKRKMSAEELDAFVLHYRDTLSVNEITKILGCKNVTGARALIQSARRKFRKIVERLRDD